MKEKANIEKEMMDEWQADWDVQRRAGNLPPKLSRII